MKKLFAVLGTFCMALGVFTFTPSKDDQVSAAVIMGSERCETLLGQFLPAGRIVHTTINWKTSAGTCYTSPGYISETQEYVVNSNVAGVSNVKESYIIYLERFMPYDNVWQAVGHTGTVPGKNYSYFDDSPNWDMVRFVKEYSGQTLNPNSYYRIRLSNPDAYDYAQTSFSVNGDGD